MAKHNEEMSDGLEIISIGKLYSGSWEKKYWSSSRGKDRYPYPVGYKTARTQNEVTYKMEILEGLKGPLFTIASTDGKSSSGQTPDIAWESFQKKGCSRVKLLRGKRFSCKIDGVEFFGFKNAFVQRLLRELVANVSGTVERSFNTQLSTSCTGDADLGHEVLCIESSECPDLLPYLAVPRITGKRSRKGKQVNSQPLNDATVEEHPVLLNGNRKSEVQNCNRSTMEENNGEALVLNDTSIANAADLCATDTLDIAEDGNSTSAVIYGIEDPSNTKDDAVAAETTISEVLATESPPEDEIGISNESSEKCEIDSVGQEIAKSMMTVLLPRALPLLKTFKRKKKKGIKSPDMPLYMSQGENNASMIGAGDIPNAIEPSENSDLTRLKEHANPPCTGCDAVASASGNLAIVPDSLDESESVCPPNNQNTVYMDVHKCEQASGGLESYGHQTLEQPTCLGRTVELPDHRVAKQESKFDIPGESQMVINARFEEGIRLTDANLMCPDDHFQASTNKPNVNPKRTKISHESKTEVPLVAASTVNNNSSSGSKVCRDVIGICSPQECEAVLAKMHGNANVTDIDNPLLNPQICSGVTKNKETKPELNSHVKLNLSSKLPGGLKLAACYAHPLPISMVLLNMQKNVIYICALCDSLEEKKSILFVYKATTEGEKVMCPSLIGHVLVTLPASKDAFNRDIAMDSSRIQFTPDAQSLVLVNSIKTPNCRGGQLNCSCPLCHTDCHEKNAVKIVQLNIGYASVVSKLNTTADICCILVCEPCYLLAAEESGKLCLWIMNSSWSEQKEKCYLPTLGCVFPCVVELKRVPMSSILVLGHNGFGEFGLWDVDKRILVSTFSTPSSSVFQCIPVSVFRWQRKGEPTPGELVTEIMDATKTWHSEVTKYHVLPPKNEDVAIWLLISTNSDSDSQFYQPLKKENQVKHWRLALLVNKMVIMGCPLDSGASTVTSVGHGIIGRYDGQVYMCDLSTGNKLGNLHYFKGARVSCISTDDAHLGALAVASDQGQLLVYLPSKKLCIAQSYSDWF